MSKSNEKKYLDALKGLGAEKGSEAPMMMNLCNESAQKLEFVMDYMEWDLLTAINSMLTYSFKTDRNNLIQEAVVNDKNIQGDIELNLSIKNKNRIDEFVEERKLSFDKGLRLCVINSIRVFYDVLHLENENE